MATNSFWDRITPEKLDAVLDGETAAFDADQARILVAPKVRRKQAPARPVVELPAAPASARLFLRRAKRELTKAAILLATGAAIMSFAPRWLPQQAMATPQQVVAVPQQAVAVQEPVVRRHTEATPEPAKPAPEPAGATPEPHQSTPEPVRPAPEPARPAVDASEPVFDRIRPTHGTYLEWAAAGDPSTFHKDGKGEIDCRSDRFVGDRVDIAKVIREAKANIVSGTMMWAEQQPDGAIDIHTYVNVREDIPGYEIGFKLRQPLMWCRAKSRRVAADQRFVHGDELKLPREMWYRTGSSLARP